MHLVWTTRERRVLIDAPMARFLCRLLRALARKEQCHVLEIGMVRTHIHLLIRLHPTTSVSLLAKRLKGASSTIAGQQGLGASGRLLWSKGYGARTVSVQTLPTVRRYLRAQPTHHPTEAIEGWPGEDPEYDGSE
ncbi:MAG: IS200/IS605 family transposase [Gemmatimonadales bacterium]